MDISNVSQNYQVVQITSSYQQNKIESVDQDRTKQEINKQNQQEDLQGKEKNLTQEQQLLNAIEKVSGKVEVQNKELSFSVHEATKQIMIKVVNKETKEVIKEIPAEKTLDMVASMMEVAGLIVDKRG